MKDETQILSPVSCLLTTSQPDRVPNFAPGCPWLRFDFDRCAIRRNSTSKLNLALPTAADTCPGLTRPHRTLPDAPVGRGAVQPTRGTL